MHWDRMFEDLEGQLASEWEAERAALDAESERLRISKVELRSRLRALSTAGAAVTLELVASQRLAVRVRGLGADWLAAEPLETTASALGRSVLVVPLDAILSLGIDHGMLLSSLEAANAEPTLRERMALGFMLRDLARRRVPVRIALHDATELHGTIDRAGTDHLDVALHDPGDVRRASAVTGFRIVPFAALAWLRFAATQLL